MSPNLVCGTLVLMVGDACDVSGVLDGLHKMHDSEALCRILFDSTVVDKTIVDEFHLAPGDFRKSAALEGIVASPCHVLRNFRSV